MPFSRCLRCTPGRSSLTDKLLVHNDQENRSGTLRDSTVVDGDSEITDYEAPDADSSEGMPFISLDEGTPDPPSPPWSVDAEEQEAGRMTGRRREKRTITSLYVR